jgi:DNA-binding NarL/FixJ family response regulator
MRTVPSSRLEEPLTPREIDVLNALADGLGNKQIAARLAISEHTVKTHLAAIFEKLDVSNRTEAVTAGARLGLILL